MKTTKSEVEKLFEKLVEEVKSGNHVRDGESSVVKLGDEEREIKYGTFGSDMYKSEIPFAVVFYQWFLDDFNCLFPVLKAEF